MSHRAPFLLIFALLLSFLPTFATAQTPRVVMAPYMNSFDVAVPVKDLPVPDAEVWLIRYILASGASLPQEYEVGNTFIVVDGGEATLKSNHAGHLTNVTGNEASAAILNETSPVQIGTGEGALIPSGVVASIHNDSSDLLQIMVLKVFAPADKYRVHLPSGSLSHQTYGVIAQTISHGKASFSSSDGVLVIARDVGPALGSAAGGIQNGVEVGALQGGMATMSFVNGTGWFWPNILSHQNDAVSGGPVPLHSNAVINLQTGDGYVNAHGDHTWRSTSDDPLIVLRGLAYSIGS